MKQLDVGIGPMSVEIVDTIIDYARLRQKKIMLIASRNQIDCEELGGGYVGGWTSESFAKYVREKDPDHWVTICRDHGGPYLNSAESGMSYGHVMARTLTSLQADIHAGFDLLHIDTSLCPDPYKAAEQMFELAVFSSRPIEFEFGSEENVGIAASPEVFERDVKFVKQFVTPRFVVGQTGTLVKSTFQVGRFNEDAVIKMVKIAEEHGVGLKEHNADYIQKGHVVHHRKLGVAALNVAPEFGVVQTQTVTDLAIRYGCEDELNAFYKRVLKGGKWKKWSWTWFTDHYKYMSSGHYFFMSGEYKSLIDAIEAKGVNTKVAISHSIVSCLGNYVL